MAKKLKEKFPNTYHYFYALILPIYLLYFFWVEKTVSTTEYHVMHCSLDDVIPFCEYFVIFYYVWYIFMLGVGLYTLFKKGEEETFIRYMKYIFLSFTIAMTICLLFPNGQDMRPVIFERDNIFTRLLSMIYAADTNTNVCPSVHVIGSLAAIFAVFDSKNLSKPKIETASVILGILIMASTVFVKQHSIIDVVCGVILSFLLYPIVYHKNKKTPKIETKEP